MLRGLPAVVGLAAAMALPGAASATHGQPAPDITKMDYSPIGFYKPGDPIPLPTSPPDSPNPGGKWNAYDVNLFESLALPGRHPGDAGNTDAPGSGFPIWGFCPPSAEGYPIWGKCDNHQLEYLDHFEKSMKEVLGDFGVTVHRYPFKADSGALAGDGVGLLLDAQGGQAYNIAAVVAGTDHPDEQILVSGHYDLTDSAPAAAWDSSEGHATVIRIAKIMADYWRATGTRPSATVKFIPWDAEESGSQGSADYVANNIVPEQESKVRGYFNLDPCAGAYPAYRSGIPGQRIAEVVQLSNPASYTKPDVKARVTAFNARAERSIDEVLDNLDDTITVGIAGQGVPMDVFVSDKEAAGGASDRSQFVTALGGLALFSSDYVNFAGKGIPILNLFPDLFGPHADGTAASVEGITILHTPRDNLTSLNALTGSDPLGLTASEGWMKGLEMCAHVHGWNMLQPEMGGAQKVKPRQPVAYFEALPNEAAVGEAVTFDANGSYDYAKKGARTLVPDKNLQFTWTFGDGKRGKGRVVKHAYTTTGVFISKLTVRNKRTKKRDTMIIPVKVLKIVNRGADNPTSLRARRLHAAAQKRLAAYLKARGINPLAGIERR